MSADTRELIEICEQLRAEQRVEVAAFARSLLGDQPDAATARAAMDRWLEQARGAASTDLTTEQIMALTRGES